MGAGKSTLGAQVAERLGRPFVDIDTEIERRASASVSTIFATQGEVEFRAIEQRLACEVLDSEPAVVVSLGGGAPGLQQTTSKLRRAGADRAARRRRRRGVASRAAFGPTGRSPRPRRTFRPLYDQRRPFYERAADSARARCGRRRARGRGSPGRGRARSLGLAEHVLAAAEVRRRRARAPAPLRRTRNADPRDRPRGVGEDARDVRSPVA